MNLETYLNNHRNWSLEKLGPGSHVKSLIAHIGKELAEIEAAPTDLYEWIDVVILALDGAWRAGYSPKDICTALATKQRRNMARELPDPKAHPEGAPFQHVGEG